MSVRGDHIQATVFLEDSDGVERKLPDWMTKHLLEKFLKENPGGKTKYGYPAKFCFDGFSWSFYSKEVEYNYRDPIHNVTGTLYNCQNIPIGKNELYTFKLEKVLYQPTNIQGFVDTRIQALLDDKTRIHSIESEIERMANDLEITDFSEKLRELIFELNHLLTQHPNIDEELNHLRELIARERKDNLLVMYINIYNKNRKQNFVAQQVIIYKIWPFPILQWYD